MTSFARTVLLVATLNLAYFGVETSIAAKIGSVSLFADSIDFLEDASLNLLCWTDRARARVGIVLGILLLAPGVATLWTAWSKLSMPLPPAPLPLSLAGLGALLVNLTCAIALARHRTRHGSLARAAFLSARNDALANIAIIGAALVAARWWPSAWPDLIVGLAIAAMNADAARIVLTAARVEARAARAP